MQQYTETMMTGNPVHQVHDHLIVVVGQVNLFENRSYFKLVRRNFIVAGFYRNSQFVSLILNILHEHGYPLRNRSKIVVFQLLVFSGGVAHQRTAS